MNSRYIIEANISKYSKMLKAEVKSTVTIEKYIVVEITDNWQYKSDALDQTLAKLDDRERYVLLSRVLEEKSFETIGKELGLKYKGVTALYSRTLAKVQKMLEEARDELL